MKKLTQKFLEHFYTGKWIALCILLKLMFWLLLCSINSIKNWFLISSLNQVFSDTLEVYLHI